MALTFPFAAIVGQDEMTLAIQVVAVDPSIGGVLVLGDRGTGKSTAVRALADAYRQVSDFKVKELLDRRYDRLQSYGRYTDTKADAKAAGK